ncbi:MAG: hypothetical protein Q9213_000478 [Squamulea squamosa]
MTLVAHRSVLGLTFPLRKRSLLIKSSNQDSADLLPRASPNNLDQGEVHITLPKEVLEDCEKAFNCETYDSGRGILTRFKKGMGPGTPSYKANKDLGAVVGGRLARRGGIGPPDMTAVPMTTTTATKGSPTDGNGNGVSATTTAPSFPYSSTRVFFGNQSLQYGSIGASGDNGAIRFGLMAACNAGQCDTLDKEVGTTYISPPADSALYVPREAVTLIVKAYGDYENITERDKLIQAMIGAASKENCVDIRWWDSANPSWGFALDNQGFPFSTQTSPRGRLRQCTQTNYMGVTRYEYHPWGSAKKGNMLVTVQWKQSTQGVGTNWCSVVSGVLGSIAGIVGAIPGLGAAAGIAGGFFGIISTSCSVT